MIITVASGKGGTGKTTFAVNLAYALAAKGEAVRLLDCDVEEPNDHLFVRPDFTQESRVTVLKPVWDEEKCTGCGKCAEACNYNAIAVVKGKVLIFNQLCHSCGACTYVCPANALREEPIAITSAPAVTGDWYVSSTDCGPMVHARLGIAEENSGRLVAQVRNRASELAAELRAERILGDGPPGTGCPVIASVSGCDLALIVTEPTVSGVHDMERVLALAAHFGVPSLVIINKADINTEQAMRIDEIAGQQNSRVIARIPFDSVVNDALRDGKTVVEYGASSAADAILGAWKEVQAVLRGIV